MPLNDMFYTGAPYPEVKTGTSLHGTISQYEEQMVMFLELFKTYPASQVDKHLLASKYEMEHYWTMKALYKDKVVYFSGNKPDLMRDFKVLVTYIF